MAVAAGAAFGIIPQTLFQIAAQFGQGFLLAGLLGKCIIQGGQFPGLEIFELDLEVGLAAACVFFGVVVGEVALHGLAVADSHAHHPFDEARDHAAVLQIHIH